MNRDKSKNDLYNDNKRSKKLISDKGSVSQYDHIFAKYKNSLTDIMTSDDNTNQSSIEKSYCIKVLEGKLVELSKENEALKKQINRYRQEGGLKENIQKVHILTKDIKSLINANDKLKQQLEDLEIQKDFFSRAYKTIKKDNQVLFKQLSSKRKQLQILKSDLKIREPSNLRRHGSPQIQTARNRTNSQNSQKSSKKRNEQQNINQIGIMMADLIVQVEKQPNLKPLEDILRKFERKLYLQIKMNSREKSKRKQYFPEFKSKEKCMKK